MWSGIQQNLRKLDILCFFRGFRFKNMDDHDTKVNLKDFRTF